MAQFDSWESYFYPETYDPATDQGTLVNLYDERHAGVLAHLEYAETARRQRQIERGEVEIPQTYDAAHLRAIHRHLFQDIYEWAGQYRTVRMKPHGHRRFFGNPPGEIDELLTDVRDVVASADWTTLGRLDFVAHIATVMAYANQAHPFREGNGRTQKIFLQQIAEQSQYQLDYTRISPHEWNRAAEDSRPIYDTKPYPRALLAVFDTITEERPASRMPGWANAVRSRTRQHHQSADPGPPDHRYADDRGVDHEKGGSREAD